MKFLIIAQDLRVSGTSSGILERSFLSKLRKVYPEAIIDVVYLCTHSQDDNLEILPVNSIERKVINTKIPFHIKWMNRIGRRLFNILVADNYIHHQFAKEIIKIDYQEYNHIMVRSAGLNHETILALDNLPILKKAIINFHDPYPFPWYSSLAHQIDKNQLKKLQKIIRVVNNSKTCSASAYYMAKDLQYLYASEKYFYTLHHQFDKDVFDFSDQSQVRKKERKIQISYHGALMFGRKIIVLVEAFIQLMKEYEWVKNEVEFVLRVKGEGINKLKEKANDYDNIMVLDTTNFSNSSNEQIYESDINIILENGPYYSNILGGKVPFLFNINKKVLIAAPERSELRRYLVNYPYIYDMNNIDDAKLKLYDILMSQELDDTIGRNLFSVENFKTSLDRILSNK